MNGNAENHLDAGFVYVDQSILEMFPLPIMAGQLNHALDKPNSLVITKVKRRSFSREMLLGKQSI
ncbi:hypothetical protein KUH03_12145 [Sphingobacterium sp. E70]|uniref:hypothetical protein n=1 Tax=Sphingobacterium sp. E70 TaxID=2853439 RepID=UPI00211C459C|nr:hypothetical protein [Sphingobacterium sp. E70]ULT27428.1 hypothetical protein KUH03_12145 [Sphingobacterium sp. E70]